MTQVRESSWRKELEHAIRKVNLGSSVVEGLALGVSTPKKADR